MASDLTFSRNNTAQTKGRAQPGAPTTDGRENVMTDHPLRAAAGIGLGCAIGTVIWAVLGVVLWAVLWVLA